ncbi:Cof-type HAD-IIB family hydrolase [Psychromonas sp. psych-6C06]|uniref:Cof-type HAD-IIB family hydrolase n=1 Tax=Psychromonas sp. psych-6C06 TaxID=2058089 RepID=UPI000C338949|nr:Cof-type HAD-IIB family hydrolase [Psychromonas sp. psych-6C06]PKF61243.1 Cof-type HAD-IIB family hydrolase [Psychromonas sp. psych-6C06]
MYKVAISDLDGTLLGPDHKVSAQTKQSIHRWVESGRKFVIATGRHYIEAKSLQDELGEPIYLITSNGARVHNREGEIILKQNLSSDIATAICDINFAEGVQVNLFTDHCWYANYAIPELTGMALDQDFYCRPTDLKTLDKSNTIKIFFYAEPELLQPVYEQLKAQFGHRINLTFSLDKCLEVMDVTANKGTAVEAVLKEKGFTRSEAIAFGDGMNDVEMLSLVGKPILMENSQTKLRDALPNAEMTLSAKEHGVAAKLNKILD